MEFKDLIEGEWYVHETLGPCLFIGHHPWDGACLIIEYDDVSKLGYCERDELHPISRTAVKMLDRLTDEAYDRENGDA